MTNDIAQVTTTGTKFCSVSSDLSQLLGERALIKLVLDAVLTLDPQNIKQAGKTSPEFQPRMMLTLLTYCYSSSIYGSKDIEWAVENDRMIRYICARTFPDFLSLRRFRRENRALIQQCIIYVMKQAWALKFDEGEADYVGYEWFESDLIEQVNASALGRLELAALMDGAESD